MAKVHIQYDHTSKCMEIFDRENGQHFQEEEVEALLGSGFTVTHEEGNVIIETPPLYKVQLRNDKGSWTTTSTCPPETVKQVYEAMRNYYNCPAGWIRILNPDGELFEINV